MQEETIDDQVDRIVATLGCGEKMSALLTSTWQRYKVFLEERGPLPARLEDVDPRTFAPFTAHCSPPGTNAEDLFKTLMCLRMLLAHAGQDARAISSLSVATTRVRIKNAKNGKYRFERQLKQQPAGASASPTPTRDNPPESGH